MTHFFSVRVESSNHYRNRTEKVFILLFDLLKKLRIIGDRFIKPRIGRIGHFLDRLTFWNKFSSISIVFVVVTDQVECHKRSTQNSYPSLKVHRSEMCCEFRKNNFLVTFSMHRLDNASRLDALKWHFYIFLGLLNFS